MTRRAETLELAVLGLLHETPMHGYELRKRLNVVLGWGRVLSYGSLYPALKRMLRAGWLVEHVGAAERPARTTRPGKPAKTGKAASASRRQRITYALTEEGTTRFNQLMADAGPTTWEDDAFGVRFTFFGRTDPDVRLRILEGRRARLEERLHQQRRESAPSAAGPDPYAAELARHALESLQREVDWLSRLIAAERADERFTT